MKIKFKTINRILLVLSGVALLVMCYLLSRGVRVFFGAQ